MKQIIPDFPKTKYIVKTKCLVNNQSATNAVNFSAIFKYQIPGPVSNTKYLVNHHIVTILQTFVNNP